jgi:hypothetical protein
MGLFCIVLLVSLCCGRLLAEIGDSEAFSRKQRFIVPAQTPENKGVSPYIPLQAGDRGN